MARKAPVNQFDSGDALFAVAHDWRILSWNPGAEQLTGVPARDAVGRRCWQVLRAIGSDGESLCHPGCSYARLLLQGRPPPSCEVLIDTPDGLCPVFLSVITISRGEQPVFLHLMQKAEPRLEPEQARLLSPRQREVVELLCHGLRAREIALHLGLAEVTARNHIYEIRKRLGCHSQLEVVAKLRRRENASSA